jgi:hypothetical protein
MHTSGTAALQDSLPTTTTPPGPNSAPNLPANDRPLPSGAPLPDPNPAVDPCPNAEVEEDLDDDIAWLNVNELEKDDADELVRCLNTCVDRWKAAGPDSRKKMFALFAVAGIFLSVCRHGHVLVMCDMIRSGEL